MTVVLWVLLGLILLLLGIAVLLLFVRTGVEAFGVTGEVSVELRYGPVRIPVWPLPKHTARARKAMPRNKTAKRRRIDWAALDLGETQDVLPALLHDLSGCVRISRLRIRVQIGTEDAAHTGILLGQAAAVTGMIVPVLENTFEMRDYHVSIDADFEADHTEWAFTVLCSSQPVQVLRVLLRHRKALFRLYKRLVRKEEAIEHE